VVEVAVCIDCDMVLVRVVVVVSWLCWCNGSCLAYGATLFFGKHKHDQMVCALPQVYKHP
jgi:phage shock protein PspC (stress-responsive transcriptional regulator)